MSAAPSETGRTCYEQDTRHTHQARAAEGVNIVNGIILLAAVFGCSADGPVAARQWWLLGRAGVRFERQAMARLKAAAQGRRQAKPCPAELERRERIRREFLALDLLKNSTEHEEYRPS